LQNYLFNYYGLLNEQAAGLTVEMPEKAEAVILWEQCEALGSGIYDGGVIDQPYIFMQEVAVIRNTNELFENLRNSKESG
jgi:hypothetical protein